MSVVKYVTSNGSYSTYDIYANTVTINGNINILGNLANIATSVSSVGNAYILVNDAETGSGITGNAAGYGNAAGFIIDRGSLPNAFWHYHETTNSFIGNVTNTLQRISAATPTDNSHVVTLSYISNASAGIAAVGANTYVQYNQGSGALGANNTFTFNNVNVTVFNTLISNGVLSTIGINSDLKLYGNGANASVYIEKGLKFNFKNITPASVSNSTLIFANTIGGGNTGLFVVNSSKGDELVGKTRAIGFNLMI